MSGILTPEDREFIRRLPVVDAHCDTLLRVGPETGRDLGRRLPDTQIDLPRLGEAGAAGQFFACCVRPPDTAHRALENVLELIDVFDAQVSANPDRLVRATGPSGIRQAHGDGRVAGILTVEGGEALEGSLGVLRALHCLGVRALTLTWSYRNALADGEGETRTGGGLTRFGVEVVREMGRLGMLVDVSHVSEAGFWQVLEEAKGPVVATHSNCRALCDHARNLTDEQIKALAAKGGVMGLNSCGAFVRLGAGPPGSEGERIKATVDDLLDHAGHIIDLVGPKHLGLGLDLDGIRTRTVGLEDVTGVPALAAGLLGRGHDRETVGLVMGGNWLRVMEEAGLE